MVPHDVFELSVFVFVFIHLEELHEALTVLEKEIEVCTRVHIETDSEIRTTGGHVLSHASVFVCEVAAECCVLCGKVCDRVGRESESLRWFARAGMVKGDAAALMEDSCVAEASK